MNTAIVPTAKLQEDFYDWYQRHDEKCQMVQATRYDLVFIGDSITHFWEYPDNRGRTVWDAAFAPLNAINLGFGWDRTQNVLWRLDHGEFENQTPKLVVLLIGTNNLTGTEYAPKNTPGQIAEGIEHICDRIQTLSPNTAILTVGVLPRGESDSFFWTEIPELNRLLAMQADAERNRYFIDIGSCLLRPDGAIDEDLVPGLTHPVTAGYQAMAEQLLPAICRMGGFPALMKPTTSNWKDDASDEPVKQTQV